MVCSNCGNEIGKGVKFCTECGTPVPEKKSKKGLIIAGIVLAALVCVALLAVFVIVPAIRGIGQDNTLLYVKEDGILRYDGKKTGDPIVEDVAVKGALERSRESYTLDHTKKYLLYIDSADSNTLYYKALKGKDEKPADIKEDVDLIIVYDKMTYFLTKSGDLYRLNDVTGKPKRIGANVASYRIYGYEAGEKIAFLEGENVLSEYNAADDKVKEIAEAEEGIINVYPRTVDLSDYYYAAEGDIYRVQNSEATLLAEDATVMGMDGVRSGMLHYRKTSETGMASLIDDPYAESDAEMTEPSRDDYKKKETFFGYEYETYDYDAYDAALAEYRLKESRDLVRETIESGNGLLFGDIYCFDGKEETLLCEGVLSNTITLAGNANHSHALVTMEASLLAEKPIPIDELIDTYDIAATLEEKILGAHEGEEIQANMILGKTVRPMTYRDTDRYYYDTANEQMYRIVLKDDNSVRRMEKAAVTSNGVGEYETVDDDFGKEPFNYFYCYSAGGRFYYLRDFSAETRKGDLCSEGEVLVEDVYSAQVTFDSEKEEYKNYLRVVSDVSTSDYSFTLSKVTGKKVEVLSDDVVQYKFFEDDSAAVLREYSTRRKTGELYRVYSAKKETEIDTDVQDISGALYVYPY